MKRIELFEPVPVPSWGRPSRPPLSRHPDPCRVPGALRKSVTYLLTRFHNTSTLIGVVPPCSWMRPAIASVSKVSARASPVVSTIRKMPAAGTAWLPGALGADEPAIAHAPYMAGPSNQSPWQFATFSLRMLSVSNTPSPSRSRSSPGSRSLSTRPAGPARRRHRDVAVGPLGRGHSLNHERRRCPETHARNRTLDQPGELVPQEAPASGPASEPMRSMPRWQFGTASGVSSSRTPKSACGCPS